MPTRDDNRSKAPAYQGLTLGVKRASPGTALRCGLTTHGCVVWNTDAPTTNTKGRSHGKAEHRNLSRPTQSRGNGFFNHLGNQGL
jgi:hypothetical protein